MSNVVTLLCRPLRLPPMQKAVLMCLADYCHDDGKDWHSIAALMAWTCLSRTTVIDALKGLEGRRLLTVERVSGRNNTTFLQLDRIKAEAGQQPAQADDQNATRTGTPAAPVREADHPRTPGLPPPVRVADRPVRVADPKHQEASHEATVKHQGLKPRGSRCCPATFSVTADLKTWAVTHAPSADLTRETEKFRLYERKKPVTDWPKAWKAWILNAETYAAERRTRTPPRIVDFSAVDYSQGGIPDAAHAV